MEFTEVDFGELVGISFDEESEDDGSEDDGSEDDEPEDLLEKTVTALEEIMISSVTVFNGRLGMKMIGMDDMFNLLSHCGDHPGNVCVMTYPYGEEGGRDGDTVLFMVGNSLWEIQSSIRNSLKVNPEPKGE